MFTYRNLPSSISRHKEQVDLYLSIGDKIRQSQDRNTRIISSIKTLVRETYRTHDRVFPSFAICLSSGTGKSQLAFTLDIPALYFVHPTAVKTESPQDIYEAFSDISEHFFNLLDEDYKSLRRSIRDRSSTRRTKYFSTSDLKSSSFSFKSLGFLVQLIKKVSELSDTRPSERWPKLELEPSLLLEYSAMTCTKAIETLLPLRKNGKLPVAFFDEFSPSRNDRNMFMFYRNIIRAVNLIPFIMGTNAHVVNMLSFTSASGEGRLLLWGYLITELPKVPDSFLEEKINHLKARKTRYQKDFLEKFKKVVKKERPLMVLKYLEALAQFLPDLTPSKESRSAVLQEILSYVFNEFDSRKADLERFFEHQVCYFESTYTKSAVGSRIRGEIIKNHLGYLNHPADCKADLRRDGIVKVGIHRQNLFYHTDIPLERPRFRIRSRYPQFSEEPLTANSFALCPSVNPSKVLFSKGYRKEYYTAFEAIKQLKLPNLNLESLKVLILSFFLTSRSLFSLDLMDYVGVVSENGLNTSFILWVARNTCLEESINCREFHLEQTPMIYAISKFTL